MNRREDLEKSERERFAPYAMLAANSRGRRHSETAPEFRTDFQRDRDRVVHSTAFRRLEYKTQVFVNHEGDHYRTRLTHTLEVSQIARTAARALLLNEDLTEVLVLAHDLGHTPFGHAGERVMTALMKNHGGFEHNLQSLRIVDELEKRYPGFTGLNLTYEVREGITKHSVAAGTAHVPSDLNPVEQPCLEAQLIEYEDEIAYNNHDVDDGLSSRLLEPEALESVDLWRISFAESQKKHPGLGLPELKHVTISKMITMLFDDLVENTEKLVSDAGVVNATDVRKAGKRLAGFSPEMLRMNQQLKDFLFKNLYTHYRVVRMEEKAKRVLTDLFGAYLARPQQLSRDFQERMKNETPARVICDYIAGMTDRFAFDEHQKLFDPHARV